MVRPSAGPFELKIGTTTTAQENIRTNLSFRFRVSSQHGTDGRTDGRARRAVRPVRTTA